MIKSRFYKKKGQTGTEYLVIVGFVTFAVMVIVAIAFVMSNSTKDNLQLKQADTFALQLINSAESVFFAGEPSKTTIDLYLPEEVKNITIEQYQIVMEIELSSGKNIRGYGSRVPLNGSVSARGGSKEILLEATELYVNITET